MSEEVVICTVAIKSMKSTYLPDLPVYPQLQMKHVTLNKVFTFGLKFMLDVCIKVI